MTALLSSLPPSGDSDSAPHAPAGTAALAMATVGAAGVVYGDIGTSPLYAFRETLRLVSDDGLDRAEIVGIVSLLIWALMIIVSGKYVIFLLHADNRGEGGDLALFARIARAGARRGLFLVALGIAGAAFFFGDAILTPAISVLSAVEGLSLVEPAMAPMVMPVAVAVLAGLFLSQRNGTARISALFGPVMVVWFVTLAGLGLASLARDPSMLGALSPLPGAAFLLVHKGLGLLVMGGVFLAVTGAEALYADLGHFGRRPIQLAWFLLVLPALVLNYLGQGALVLHDPSAAADPFFLLAPEAWQPVLVALSMLATVIAAQAVITGAFSMARQAIQLGLLPRMDIRHTSEDQSGQIYLPAVNWFLMLGTIWLIAEFGSSSALASAYGISVSASMAVTSTMAILYLIRARHWPRPVAVAAVAPVMALEMFFLAANSMKFMDGGYVPVGIALVAMLGMTAWVRGTTRIARRTRKLTVDLQSFIANTTSSQVQRVPGMAVFLTSEPHSVPPALLHNLKHNRILHDRNTILTVIVMDVPRVPEADRCEMTEIGPGFLRVLIRFGFTETPNLTRAMQECRRMGLKFDVMTTSFFLGRRKFVSTAPSGISLALDRIFIALGRLAADPADYFHLPRDRVVEVGARMSL